jgi:hypothetical protein
MATVLTAQHVVRRIAADRAALRSSTEAHPASGRSRRPRSCGVTDGSPAGRRGADALVGESAEGAGLHLYFS